MRWGIGVGGPSTDAANWSAPSMRRCAGVDAIRERAWVRIHTDETGARFPVPPLAPRPVTPDGSSMGPPDIAAPRARLSQSVDTNSPAE